MNFWLLKTEPSCWSWSDQIKERTTTWDGVRNALAQKYMQSMNLNDLAFFYHTGKDKHICGTVKIIREHYLDPTDTTQKFHTVDVTTESAFPAPVSLTTIKQNPHFEHLPLVRLPRLSVMPIDANSWTRLCALGGL